MSFIDLHYQLPENLKAAKFIAKLAEKTGLEIVSQEYSQKRFYDTFDWRLFETGLLCELNQSKSHSRLTLLDAKSGRTVASADMDEVPQFAAEFDDEVIKAKLAPILEVRALLSLTSLPYLAYRINILNKERKTTVRLLLEDYEELPARLIIRPVRGYDKAKGRLVRLLTSEFALKGVKKSVLQSALKLQRRRPLDYSSKLTFELDPDMRADIACKYIYSYLLRMIKVNEAGTIDAVDDEFLHDFRVAVRRTRVGMGQLKNVLPESETAIFTEFFAWLGQITGPARDMDVYLQHFVDYRQSLPASIRKDIDPLRDFIARKRQKVRGVLTTKLKSAEYLGKLQQWEDYLKESPAKKPAEHDASLSIRQVADKRIWAVYRRVIKQGDAIDADSPPEALHTLRKTCKKLRYLMEFFQSLYPDKKIAALIKALKNFQDILGDFQDYQIQEETLMKFADEMVHEQVPAETLIAMGMLVQNLQISRQRAREEFGERFRRFRQAKNRTVFTALFAGNKAKS